MSLKIAFAIDYILDRNDALQTFELLINLIPDADILTLAHRRGVGGSLEDRKIYSSYLSHIVKTEKDILKHPFLYMASKPEQFINEKYDYVICFSLGFAHCLKWNERQINYIYDKQFMNDTFFKSYRKIFLPLYKKLERKNNQEKTVLSSLQYSLGPFSDLIPPVFFSADYGTMDQNSYLTQNSIALCFGDSIDEAVLSSVKNWCDQKNLFLLVFSSFKEASEDTIQFFKYRCDAVIATHFKNSILVIDATKYHFPKYTFAAMVLELPSLTFVNTYQKEFIENSDTFYVKTNEELLLSLDQVFLGTVFVEKGAARRRKALGYGGRQFKKSWDSILMNLAK